MHNAPQRIFPLAITAAPGPVSGIHHLGMIEQNGLALLGRDAAAGPLAPQAFLDAVIAVAAMMPCVPMRAAEEPIDTAAARRLLQTGQDRFNQLLTTFKGRDEWSIHIEPGITSEQHDSTQHAPGSGRGYLEQRRAEHAEADGLSKPLARAASRLARCLAPFIVDSRTFPANGGATLALLVDRREAEAMEHVFIRTAQAEPHPCTLTGPWPAFSFTTLDANLNRAA